MVNRKNKRGIKVKRCCASCKYKEIDNMGVRHCTKGYASCLTCRNWRMRNELRRAGTPFGMIKTKEYLRYVLTVRDREINGSCFMKCGPLMSTTVIRKEYKKEIYTKF